MKNEKKKNIFLDNKNKCLIYCWVNNLDGKSYVGSTTSFYTRFYKYYNIGYLEKHKTPLHNALLKYGYSNFSLEIVEYCNLEDCVKKEQYYLDLLKPESNILQIAGSLLGFKHNRDTLKYFKNIRKLSPQAKNKLSIAASNRIVSDLERIKLSDTRKGTKLSNVTRDKISQSMTKLIGVPVPVIIKDTETNTDKCYSSLTEAAKDIGISRTAIKKACVSGNILKKRYYVKV